MPTSNPKCAGLAGPVVAERWQPQFLWLPILGEVFLAIYHVPCLESTGRFRAVVCPPLIYIASWEWWLCFSTRIEMAKGGQCISRLEPTLLPASSVQMIIIPCKHACRWIGCVHFMLCSGVVISTKQIAHLRFIVILLVLHACQAISYILLERIQAK